MEAPESEALIEKMAEALKALEPVKNDPKTKWVLDPSITPELVDKVQRELERMAIENWQKILREHDAIPHDERVSLSASEVAELIELGIEL